ncbi:MAG: tRNA glutamyl-Q(34) synthetase GluQRS [Betaproteobacteria bacterium]|nr:tRNA glutamyl-Q(34) synthetase GluQRS [Betaproteobacteria bacterium]
MYVGRFAPSPTGPLHFGSLVAALASYLDARAAGGRWLLRIEDLDRPRVERAAAGAILRQLESLGLQWDGEPVWQSRRAALYRAALDALARRGLTYPCGCSRREIADSTLGADGARIYPGTCRGGLPPGRLARATRLRTGSEPIRFVDRVQGELVQALDREVGDFVLHRADGMFAYQLAVVVDDAAQGVTDVVRGADLLGSTARQIYLQRLLGYPEPRYAHVPVAVNAAGEKLSKQTGALAIGLAQRERELARALAFLGQEPPRGLGARELLDWARNNWRLERVPRLRAAPAPAEATPG